MSLLMTVEGTADPLPSLYTTARLVGQHCTTDILTKSIGKNGNACQSVSSSSEDSRFKNTRMCVFFQKGACTKGSKCTYAHTTKELKSAPNLYKTRLCQDWFNGSCVTPNCRFAHGRHELRFTYDYYKTKLCHFWQNGGCTKGNMCRHAHGEEELRPMPTELEPEMKCTSDSTDPMFFEPFAAKAGKSTAAIIAAEAQGTIRFLPIAPVNKNISMYPHCESDLPGKSKKATPSRHKRRTGRGANTETSPDTHGSMSCSTPSPTGSVSRGSSGLICNNIRELSTADNLAEAIRLAQAATELANQSSALIERVKKNETVDMSYLLPWQSQNGISTTYVTGARHSVASPVEFMSSASTCIPLYDDLGDVFTNSDRIWDQRHSAPECDLQSLAEEILPLLTCQEELRLTSKLGINI